MKLNFNNYRKYISGNLFALAGYFIFVISIIAYFALVKYHNSHIFNPDEYFTTDVLIEILLQYTMIAIFVLGIVLTLLEFVIRKILKKQILQPNFKELSNCQKIHTILFWVGIVLTQFSMPRTNAIAPMVLLITEPIKFIKELIPDLFFGNIFF